MIIVRIVRIVIIVIIVIIVTKVLIVKIIIIIIIINKLMPVQQIVFYTSRVLLVLTEDRGILAQFNWRR
jgi:hypothetical protein